MRERLGSLGQWNDVPDRPSWFYGVLLRHADKSLTVSVHHADGRRLEFTLHPTDALGTGTFTPDRHAAAQAAIDAPMSQPGDPPLSSSPRVLPPVDDTWEPL